MPSSAAILLIFLGLLVDSVNSSGEWSYEGDNGPEHWDHVSPICGGKKQSPIDIKNTISKYKSDLGEFKFDNYDDVPSVNELELINNGHAVQVNVPESLDISVKNGGLPTTGESGEFKLVQFHMHWGSTDCRGSEHTVEGRHYPLEIHFVHYNTKYNSSGEAINHEDGLAVLGVFVDTNDKRNTAFDKITSLLPQVKYLGTSVKISNPFSLDSFLPSNRKNFIRYSGSLTTPNCNEVVTWTLFNEPIYISHAQMNAMRAVSFDKNTDEDDKPMENNYRPVLPLNSRLVYKTFNDDVRRPDSQTTCGATGGHQIPAILALTLVVAMALRKW